MSDDMTPHCLVCGRRHYGDCPRPSDRMTVEGLDREFRTDLQAAECEASQSGPKGNAQ